MASDADNSAGILEPESHVGASDAVAAAETAVGPGVNYPPPTLFVVSCLTGVLVESQIPLPLSSLIDVPGIIPLGWTATVIGTALLVWGLTTFRRARTAIYPNQPARKLVAHGPFQFSRNPMYVSLTVIYLGVGLLADNIWVLLLLPVTLVILARFVIQREEEYLAREFEEQWTEYSSRVRRWL